MKDCVSVSGKKKRFFCFDLFTKVKIKIKSSAIQECSTRVCWVDLERILFYKNKQKDEFENVKQSVLTILRVLVHMCIEFGKWFRQANFFVKLYVLTEFLLCEYFF